MLVIATCLISLFLLAYVVVSVKVYEAKTKGLSNKFHGQIVGETTVSDMLPSDKYYLQSLVSENAVLPWVVKLAQAECKLNVFVLPVSYGPFWGFNLTVLVVDGIRGGRRNEYFSSGKMGSENINGMAAVVERGGAIVDEFEMKGASDIVSKIYDFSKVRTGLSVDAFQNRIVVFGRNKHFGSDVVEDLITSINDELKVNSNSGGSLLCAEPSSGAGEVIR